MKLSAWLFLLPLMIGTIFSQEAGNKGLEESEANYWNTVTVGVGRGYDIREHGTLSHLGLDYLRRINSRWEWGIQMDLDWEKNLDEFEGIQLAGVVTYIIRPRWPVIFGLGVASETDKNEAFLRLGTIYVIPLKEDERLFLSAGIIADSNPHDISLSVLIAIGWMW